MSVNISIIRSARSAELSCVGTILLATIICYFKVTENDFVWDSIPFVLGNSHIQAFRWENLYWVFTHAHRANWQPLTWISHTIDFALFGLNPAAHHAMNVAYHILDSLLLYWVLRKLLRRMESNQMILTSVAGLSALIFAIHPQHVESVAMIAQRKDTLYCLFELLCIISYLNYTEGLTRQTRRFWYGMLLGCFILSLLSKPMAVTIPVVLLVLDLYPLRRLDTSFTRNELWLLVREKLPLFALSLLVSYITLQTQTMAMPSTEHITVLQRSINTIHNLAFYQWKFLVPLHLSPFYPFPPSEQIYELAYWLPALLFSGLISGLGIILWIKGRKGLLTGWMIYLVTLAPVCGIIQVGPAAATDHYTYMASIPSCLLVAFVITRAARVRNRLKHVFIGLGAAYLISLGALTSFQVTVWRTPFQLWNRVLELHPGAALAHRNLASAYIYIGDYPAALEHILLLRSWRLDVDELLANTLLAAGRRVEAVNLYKQMIGSAKYSEAQHSQYQAILESIDVTADR